jgi:hypothetical protein
MARNGYSKRKEIPSPFMCPLCNFGIGAGSQEAIKIINENGESRAFHTKEILEQLIPPKSVQNQITFATLLGIQYPEKQILKPKKIKTEEVVDLNSGSKSLVETSSKPKTIKEKVYKNKRYKENFCLLIVIKETMRDLVKVSPIQFSNDEYIVLTERLETFWKSSDYKKRMLAKEIYIQLTEKISFDEVADPKSVIVA